MLHSNKHHVAFDNLVPDVVTAWQKLDWRTHQDVIVHSYYNALSAWPSLTAVAVIAVANSDSVLQTTCMACCQKMGGWWHPSSSCLSTRSSLMPSVRQFFHEPVSLMAVYGVLHPDVAAKREALVMLLLDGQHFVCVPAADCNELYLSK